MIPLYVVLTLGALGIEVGWMPLPDGGHEYTIQIEPEVLEILKQQEDEVFSEVPPQINVRRYRLKVGRGKLARVVGPDPRSAAIATVPAPLPKTPEGSGGAPHAESKGPTLAEATDKTRPADDTKATADHPPLGHKTWADPETPAKLNDAPRADALRTSGHDEPPAIMNVKKPAGEPGDGQAEPAKPWIPFITAIVILCCSLGANVFLGWAAWEARSRYRAAIAKLRPSPAG
jgi:hypothetical protein